MAKIKKIDTIWVIAYIDSEQLEKTETFLAKYEEYEEIKAFIPTVKILKKSFKQKEEFQQVPLLFNYGFFRVPKVHLRNPEFFSTMRDRIPSIYQWVKDNGGGKVLKHRFKFKDEEEEENRPKEYIKIATATQAEIDVLIKEANKTTIFDHNDLDNITKGSHIILFGYPWEDMHATVISIDRKKEKVTVELIMDDYTKIVEVSFHNVYYSIYQGDHRVEPIREKSLEELKYKGKKIADQSNQEG